MPGWQQSAGAHLELHLAHRLGLRIATVDELCGDPEPLCQQAVLLGLLADIRRAAGDPTGKLMHGELVEHIAAMRTQLTGAQRDAQLRRKRGGVTDAQILAIANTLFTSGDNQRFKGELRYRSRGVHVGVRESHLIDFARQVESVALERVIASLPGAAEQVADFIGSNFNSFTQDDACRDNDRYSLSAHDLLSAFEWLAEEIRARGANNIPGVGKESSDEAQ